MATTNPVDPQVDGGDGHVPSAVAVVAAAVADAPRAADRRLLHRRHDDRGRARDRALL